MDDFGTLFTTPARIVETGERMYAERYQARLEREHSREFVAIDVTNGEAYVARFPEQALQHARAQAPAGIFHLIRIGSPGAFRVSHVSSADEARDWLLRPGR
jgi:hypothetical protein